MGIGGVVAAVAAGAAVSMSGRHARAEEAALHAKVLDVLYRRSLTGPPAADEGERVITLATDNVERVSEYRQVFLPDILAALPPHSDADWWIRQAVSQAIVRFSS